MAWKRILKLLSLLVFLAIGCSSTQVGQKKEFVIKSHWLRSTPKEELLHLQRMNHMRPIVTDKLVISGNAFDRLTAFDRRTGNVLWIKNLKDGVGGGAQLLDNWLFFGASNGLFYALNAETGKTEWTFPVRVESLGEPLVHNGVVYFLAGNDILYALKAVSGRKIWVYNRLSSSQLSIRGASRPMVWGKNLYLGFSDGSFVALNKKRGTVNWEKNINQNKRFRDVDSSPVSDGQRIYVSSFDGALYCLNPKDGSIYWKVEEGGYAPVLIVKDTLYYSTSNGKVMALDRASGKVKWTRDGVQGVATGFAFYRGLLVYGESQGALQILDASTGQQVGEYKTGRGVTSAPALDEKTGDVYFLSASATLYALQLGWEVPQRTWLWK